jgi:hypothetical protein
MAGGVTGPGLFVPQVSEGSEKTRPWQDPELATCRHLSVQFPDRFNLGYPVAEVRKCGSGIRNLKSPFRFSTASCPLVTYRIRAGEDFFIRAG